MNTENKPYFHEMKHYILMLCMGIMSCSVSWAQQVEQPDTTNQYPRMARLKGVGGSIVPGVLLHGMGHKIMGDKETGRKLLKIEGISLATGVGSLVALGLLGNADETAGVLIPVSMFSFGTFAATWLFDIMGTSGLSNHLTPGNHPYQQSFVNFSYIQQDNNQSPYYNFYGGTMQYANNKLFAQLYTEVEESSDYQEYAFKGGYNIRKKDYTNLYVIPELKYRHSSEGFSISQFDVQLEMDINLAKLSNTLKNVYFINTLGYGNSQFHFGGNGFDYSNNLMIISQGIRVTVKDLVDISTRYIRREDGFIAGRNYLLTHFEHRVRLNFKDLFTELRFTHGQGFRTTINLGLQL
ncbi:MAG: hypothetical protein ACPG6V_14000 [Flavobacteriales bacterium]